MSEIGASNYFTVGYFLGIPVYEPLWTIEIGILEWDKRKVNAQPGQLVIGGGGGEHPAIICRNIDYCVARLVTSRWSPINARPLPEMSDLVEDVHTDHRSPPLEFCSWCVDDYVEFYDRCKYQYSRIANYDIEPEEDVQVYVQEDGTEYRNPPSTSFEAWLCLNVGEFVYAAIPDLTPNVRKWRDELGPIQRAFFRGILVSPPGYPDEGCLRPDEWGPDIDKEKQRGGASRFQVADRFPGYHENPEWAT